MYSCCMYNCVKSVQIRTKKDSIFGGTFYAVYVITTVAKTEGL